MQRVAIKSIVTLLVVAHLLGNLWHGDAHAILEIVIPDSKIPFVIIVILASPIIGAILIWTRYGLLGCWIVGVSMVGSVVFSVYHHYVLISIDNVEHLPPGAPDAHAHFSNSAEFIAIAALASALAAFYAAGKFDKQTTGALGERKSESE